MRKVPIETYSFQQERLAELEDKRPQIAVLLREPGVGKKLVCSCDRVA
jgi:hypothetical protein